MEWKKVHLPLKPPSIFVLQESPAQGKTNKKQNARKNETQVKTQQNAYIVINPR